MIANAPEFVAACLREDAQKRERVRHLANWKEWEQAAGRMMLWLQQRRYRRAESGWETKVHTMIISNAKRRWEPEWQR